MADRLAPFARPADDDNDGRPDPIATLSVTLAAPAGGTAVAGAQPGVGVELTGAVNYRRVSGVSVQVRVGEMVFPATLGASTGNRREWRCLVRFYTRGPVDAVAEASGESMLGDGPIQAVSDPRTFTVTLDSAVPDISIVQPTPGDVTVGEQGELLALLARTSDGFGPRTLTWECEGRTGGTVQQPGRPGDFNGRVSLTPLPLGPRTITVSCTDAAHNSSSTTVTVTARDRTPPVLTINDPRPGQTFAAGAGGITITVRGQTSDRQSGMAGGLVEWSTDGGAHFHAATTTDDWATWRAEVPLADFGAFTVDIRAHDRDGNTVTSRLPLQVVADYHPRDLDERLDARSYLASLLAFARDQVRTATGANLSSVDLQDVFHQRFGTLSQPLSQIGDAGVVPVNQLLVACEVLRAHQETAPDGLLAAHWSFDTATVNGGTAADLSGGGHDAVATGGIVLEPGHGGGQSVRFDGKNRFLTVPTGPAIGTDGADFTVAFHLRLEQGFTGQWRSVLHKGATNQERTFAIWLNPGSNRLHARISTTVDWNEGLDTVAEVPVGRWTHVAYVKSGNQLRLYLDGTLDRALTLQGRPVDNQGPLYIGKDPWYDGFDGLIDDLHAFRFALGEKSIRALAAAPDPAAPADVLAAGRTAYVWSAYEAFLTGIGTSYEELRLARGASSATRTALADRIGIRLTATYPDELTRLTLSPTTADEALLEELFGLRDTDPARSPLRPSTEPLVAQWRDRALTLRWYEADHAPQPPDRGFAVLVDPDLIGPDDLAATTVGNPAAALLQARRAEVQTIRETLRSAREAGGATAADQMATLLKAGLPDADLPGIAADQEHGVDVGPALAAIPLSREAFGSLLRTMRLADTGIVTQAEWEDAYDILTAVEKARSVDAWRAQETLISLGPDFFRLSDSPFSLPRWRASRAVRDAWQRVLRTRIEERESAAEAYRSLVADVEETALPLLRDALVAATAGERVAADCVEWLTTRLQLDLRAGGALRTTRINQATETLQSTLFAVRTGRLPEGHPAGDWTLADEATFDDALRWMSTDGSWRAAMTAYLYPENLLQPSLLHEASGPLTTLVRQLRLRRHLTPEDARDLAAAYFAAQLPYIHAGRLPQPAAAWTFDDGDGTTAADPAGSTGTLHGPQWTAGAIGGALTFDGVDDRVSIQRTPDLAALVNTFTISFWADPRSAHQIDPESSDGTAGTSGQRYALGPAQGSTLWGQGHAGVGISVGTNGVSVYEHSDNYLPPVLVHEAPIPAWTHIAVVYEDRRARLYVNGHLVRSRSTQSAMTSVHAAPEALGGMDYGFFHGRLDDIRVFPAALTSDQIELLAFRITDRRDDSALAAVRTLSRRLLSLYVAGQPPRIGPEASGLVEVFAYVPMALALKLCESGEYLAALDWWQNIYAHDLPPEQRLVHYGLTLERNDPPDLSPSGDWTSELDPFRIARTRPNPLTRSLLLNLARCCAEYANAEFTQDTPASVARARSLYTTALDLLTLPDLQPAVDPAAVERPLPNPAVEALRSTVDAHLDKLRQGRNIAGLPRTHARSDGQTESVRPTSYRYRTLIERTRQFTALAQQAEGAYLEALEKYDAAALRHFNAGQAIELAQSDVLLQGARVTEAQQAVEVARAQRSRADGTASEYQKLINGGLNQYEKSMLEGYWQAKTQRDVLGVLEASISIGQSAQGIIAPWQAAVVGPLAAQYVGRAIGNAFLNATETRIQSDTLLAAHESQVESWRLQIGLAAQDALVADQQVLLASDQQAITEQEQRAAQLRADQAQATLDFLDRQFTGPELYEWMSGILAGVYRTLLQQATALARLAQDQLAFERQETPATVVLADYWQPPSEGAAPDQPSTARDRRGLTGSARLLQDVALLDEYAFETERRKLNLSQTFSLAQRTPLEFELFRQTGMLRFATPMEWFDRDFPGHHLRLIKRVSLSVIGLIPPGRGIRATLASAGISRAVVADDTVREVVLRRDPELVAVTSALGATGVFDLDIQADLQFPFEGQGVDTTWEFQLPPAANPFDYTSLADVRLTVEYTALHSDTYRRQVVQRLNRDRLTGADRVFSLQRDFPDQWYDLHNPATTEGSRQVRLTLTEEDLPSSLERVTVTHLAILLVTDSAPEPFDITLLHGGYGGEARPVAGLISTRRGNAPAWTSIRGTTPAGDWILTLAEGASDLIDGGLLSDVLLVIGYEGQTPLWQ